MLIKEGSKLEIYDNNDERNPLIEEIIANEEIELEGTGEGYTILLRSEGYDMNSIFESERIKEIGENTYEIYGYFKDALLVVQNKKYKTAIYSSYMDV